MKIFGYIVTTLLLCGILTGCSVPESSVGGNSASQNSPTDRSENTPTGNTDPMQGLTDAEKQYMELYISEGKERLQNIGQGWQSISEGHQRADIVDGYRVYTRILSSYPTNETRKKVLAAVYEEGAVPVRSLEDVPSTNKRGNIIVDGTSYTPYIDAGFFFESEFTDNSNSKLSIEFKHRGEIFSNTVTLP